MQYFNPFFPSVFCVFFLNTESYEAGCNVGSCFLYFLGGRRMGKRKSFKKGGTIFYLAQYENALRSKSGAGVALLREVGALGAVRIVTGLP